MAREYLERLVAHDFAGAWLLLGDEERAHRGSEAAFADERKAFFTSAGSEFTLSVPTHDLAAIWAWVIPENPPSATPNLAGPDYDRAFLVEVDYPALAGNNAGWEVLLVAPDPTGAWRIWQLR